MLDSDSVNLENLCGLICKWFRIVTYFMISICLHVYTYYLLRIVTKQFVDFSIDSRGCLAYV